MRVSVKTSFSSLSMLESGWKESSPHDCGSRTVHSLPDPHPERWDFFMLVFVSRCLEATLTPQCHCLFALCFRRRDRQCGQGWQHSPSHCCSLRPRAPHQHAYHQRSRLHQVCLLVDLLRILLITMTCYVNKEIPMLFSKGEESTGCFLFTWLPWMRTLTAAGSYCRQVANWEMVHDGLS